MDLSTVRADPGPSQHRDIRLSHAIAAAATHAQIALRRRSGGSLASTQELAGSRYTRPRGLARN